MLHSEGNTPPIEWPTVTIDGTTYLVKHGPRVTYRASKMGIELRNLSQAAFTFATHLDLFAVMIAPQFEALGQPTPSGEDWAEIVMRQDDPTATVTSIAKAIRDALILDAKTRPATKTPATQDPANMGTVQN